MSADIVPFNPLDKKNLGESVADALLKSEAHPLGELPDFRGAGIYAIYYSGSFSPYETLAKRNREAGLVAPIYVGKAIPAGARKGGTGTNGLTGRPLYSRLAEHAESIRAVAPTLEISHFHCRFLVVDDIWIPLGESLLIARYSPIWNSLVDGFGNHDPGKGRYDGMRPRWDVLHPGRALASRCKDRPETKDRILQDVEIYLRNLGFS